MLRTTGKNFNVLKSYIIWSWNPIIINQEQYKNFVIKNNLITTEEEKQK